MKIKITIFKLIYKHICFYVSIHLIYRYLLFFKIEINSSAFKLSMWPKRQPWNSSCLITQYEEKNIWQQDHWSMINKNSKRESGVQPKLQKNKIAILWLLPQSYSEMSTLPLGISKWDCIWELFIPIWYSFLGLGLKACTTLFLWQTNVALVWD